MLQESLEHGHGIHGYEGVGNVVRSLFFIVRVSLQIAIHYMVECLCTNSTKGL